MVTETLGRETTGQGDYCVLVAGVQHKDLILQILLNNHRKSSEHPSPHRVVDFIFSRDENF